MAVAPARVLADERVEAEELFARGRAAMASKDYARACAFFEASLRAEEATGTLLNLALCHEARGAIATAWGEFRAVEQRSRAAQPPQTERADFAAEREQKLRARLPRLRIRVTGEARVALDDRPIAPELFEFGVPVDPGEHTISASAPNKRPWRTVVRITREGEATEVGIPILAQAEEPARAAHPGRTQRTVGFVLGGAGLASVAVGAVFGALALSKRSEAQCPSPCVDDTGPRAAYSRALVDANVANVTIGAGLVTIAVGLVLVLTDTSAPAGPTVGAVRF